MKVCLPAKLFQLVPPRPGIRGAVRRIGCPSTLLPRHGPGRLRQNRRNSNRHSAGAAIPNATLTVTGTENGSVRTVTSNASGST